MAIIIKQLTIFLNRLLHAKQWMTKAAWQLQPTGEDTGIGFSLSYDIITHVQGGEIKVESKESEFTEFIIILPPDL